MNLSEVDKHIAASPEESHVALKQVREIIKKLLPKAEEKISYGVPTFTLNGKNLIHYAGYKNHLGLYPGAGPIVKFKQDLIGYKQAKGSVQFPLSEPIPTVLITKIVNYCVKLNLEKLQQSKVMKAAVKVKK